MKYSSIFKNGVGCKDEREVFAYLINNLNDSIRYWDYFVNWEKVLGNTRFGSGFEYIELSYWEK